MKINKPIFLQAIETANLFRQHKSYLVAELKLSETQFNELKQVILRHGGYFDSTKTYCGQGELGDKLVPDLWFSFAGYCHDSLGKYLERGGTLWFIPNLASTDDRVDWINLVFDKLLESIAGRNKIKQIFAWVYYVAVDVFYTAKDIEDKR